MDDYVTELRRLNAAIEDAAARQQFEEAGHIFTELLELQFENRSLAASVKNVHLNRGPSRAAGLPLARR